MTAGQEPLVALGDRVHVWLGDLGAHEQTNVGIVVADDAVVVVDANFPWAARRILDTIERRWARPVRFVVNTHYHVDHSLGNQVFADAGAVVVGAAGQRRELLEKGPADAVVQIGEVPDRFCPARLEFTGALTLHDPTLELRAVGPAHTAADAVAWLPDDGVLFVGDLAVAWDDGNNFSDPDADLERWIRVLDDLTALGPAQVVPAHGRLATAADLQDQRRFLEALWSAAGDALRRADGPEDLRSGAMGQRILEQHRDYAIDRAKYAEMAESVLDARRASGG